MAKRLVKIAKELNVGSATIIEYLVSKGYSVENKPTTKITDEMELLLREWFNVPLPIPKLRFDTPKLEGLKIKGKINLDKFRPINRKLEGNERLKVLGTIDLDKIKTQPRTKRKVRKDNASLDVIMLIERAKKNHWKKLDLSSKNLNGIPPEVLSLKKLTHLNLSYNEIKKIPDGIQELKRLNVLNLSHNSLIFFPAINPSKLKVLNLEFNNIEDINLNKNNSIKSINLADNELTNIPISLNQCKELQQLFIQGNNIQAIPRWVFSEMTKLKKIYTHHNPIENVPIEITSKNGNRFDNIAHYFISTADSSNTRRIYEIKLIVVGKGEVGKTTLIEYLIDDNFGKVGQRDSTKGIKINSMELEEQHFEYINENVKVNIWDFGGQEIYYPTHQFFLTKRSIYLFVWDARKSDSDNNFNYWLNTIQTYGKDSPVVMVMNKAEERSRKIDEYSLSDLYPMIEEFTSTSCKTGLGLNDLKYLIIPKIIKDLKFIGNELPISWINVKTNLENSKKDYIYLKDFEIICQAEGIHGENAYLLLEFLHDLGVLMNFKNNYILKEIVILNPKWATEGVYWILDNDEVNKNNGKFEFNDFKRIWNQDRYSNTQNHLLALMKYFGICFEFKKHTFIIPDLLPTIPASYPPIAKDFSITLEYQYMFCPPGLLAKFICKAHHKIEDDHFWKYGVVLKNKKKVRALVTQNWSSKSIKIIVSHPNQDYRKEFENYIWEVFDDIHEEYGENLRYTLKYSCTCSNVVEPCLFDFRKLLDFKEENIQEIRCHKKERGFRFLPIDSLIKGDHFNRFEEIIKLVEKNKIMASIDQLKKYISFDEALKNEHDASLIILTTRLKSLEEYSQKGILSTEHTQIERNRITSDLVNIIKDVQKRSNKI